MGFVPQFAFRTPAGFRDEPRIQYFDDSNTPGLVGNGPSPGQFQGENESGVPLIFDSDAPFWLRAIHLNQLPAMDPQYPLLVKFKDPFGNYLSDDWVTALDYAPLVFEPPIEVPAGGVFWIYFKNPAGNTLWANLPQISFLGLKRYPICQG